MHDVDVTSCMPSPLYNTAASSTNLLEAGMSYSIPRAACFTARRTPLFRQRNVRVFSEIKSPMDRPGGKVTKKEQLLEAKKKLEDVILNSKCNPILVRLAWHDSGTYVSLPQQIMALSSKFYSLTYS